MSELVDRRTVTLLGVLITAWRVGAGEVDSDYWARTFPAAPTTSAVEFGQAYARPERYVALWTAQPAADECDLSAGVVVRDAYGLTNDLQTVRTDLDRFLGDVGLKTGRGKPLVLRREAVADHESYRLDVTPEGVTLVAGDDDGIRRGVYYLENRLLAFAAPALKVGSTVRRSWMKTRFSRSFFAPINRAPRFSDELMDDVDYYPDALLDRLAHEGVNAIWLTQRLRDVASTSFAPREPNADRRVRKLRAVARKLRRYGIGLWVFGIEPAAIRRGDRHYDPRTDPLLRDHPDWFRKDPYDDFYVMCPCEPGARQFLRELMADLFRQAPELAGYVNISHGERQTTCFSRVCASPRGEMGGEPMAVVRGFCPTCAAQEPWHLHELFASALVEGMRSAKPSARLVSWFYMPYRVSDRHDWVFEVPRHLPDGVTLMFNFESGMREVQLGKVREGGDYWLSHVGPAASFPRMAAAGCRGVKLQVGNDYGLGTVPLVPAPALLYRKYRLLHGMGTDTVLQNWLIGGMPGLQNTAAGELVFEDFADGEDAFLRRLAAPVWGAAGAGTVAATLKAYSDAFSNYPLSMVTQYYSPLNEGVAWPLYPDVEMKPLMPSWKPHMPPCGDTVGEAFDNHTLDEAFTLVSRMDEVPDARLLPGETPQQRRERDLMRAVALHFRSARNDLAFYRHRRDAVSRSRDFGDAAGAIRAVDAMAEIVRREAATAVEMKTLATRNPMLGYQSEAEFRRYFPAVFDWRTNELAWAGRRLAAIRAALQRGEAYPESARERTAARCAVGGPELCAGDLRWRLSTTNGVLRMSGTCRATGTGDCLDIAFMDATASEHPIAVTVTPDGPLLYRRGWAEVGCDLSLFTCRTTPAKGGFWSFEVELDARAWGGDPARRPAWLSLQAPRLGVSWPKTEKSPFGRLRLGPTGDGYGRVIWP